MSQTIFDQVQQDTGLKIVKPDIRVLAQTQVVDEDLLNDIYSNVFPSYTSNSDGGLHDGGEYLIEYAGRRCYESFHNPAGRTTDEYIRNILTQRHYSVLEHVHITFELSGISRALTHELIRHRHFNYSQLSQRYVDSTEASYICPPLILAEPKLALAWLNSIHAIQTQLKQFAGYVELFCAELPQKQKREAIRSLAPNALETKIVVTGNLRSWREALDKRWNEAADAEIQQVFGMIAEELIATYPSAMQDVVYQQKDH